MNTNLKNLIMSSSLCFILTTSAIACEKHQSNQIEDTKQTTTTAQMAPAKQTEDTKQNIEVKNNKKFDYEKISKTLPETVKKEVDDYYAAIGTEYEKLSDDAKKAIAKISNYKKNAFAKKGNDAKKKDTNS
jgi:hypothetical protein